MVGTWSAHWILTVSVLFLRLCYSGITFYQQYENNLVQTWSALWSLTVCVLYLIGFVILVLHYINNMKTILAGNANAFFKNQLNNMERKIHGSVHLLYPCKAAF